MVSFFFPCPMSLYAMYRWLENCGYKTVLNWWSYVLATCLALINALIQVNLQP